MCVGFYLLWWLGCSYWLSSWSLKNLILRTNIMTIIPIVQAYIEVLYKYQNTARDP